MIFNIFRPVSCVFFLIFPAQAKKRGDMEISVTTGSINAGLIQMKMGLLSSLVQ
jgi:hypothetical protein